MEYPDSLTWECGLAIVGGAALISVLPSALSSLRTLCSHTHSCGKSVHPPRADGTCDRYFLSRRTGMWTFHQSWMPKGEPRGVVYIVHGIGEYSSRYEKVARTLAANGLAVHALDHQGHGQSEGDRAYFRALDDLVEDVIQFVTEVRPAPRGLPRFLLGHSMGGLISLHVCSRTQALWTGLVLTGPALYFDPAIDTPVNRMLARLLNGVLPKLPVQRLDLEKLCTDPTIVEHYARDPLSYLGGIRVRVGCEMMDGVAAAFAFADSIKLPLLIAHGESDLICGIQGSERYMVAVGSKDKTLKRYPGLKHEVFLERTGDAVISDVVEWIQAKM